MRQNRPDHDEIANAVARAAAAAKSSAELRKKLRRRQTPTRAAQLDTARDRCSAAAPQLRSWIGMCAWGGIALDDELAMKRVMEALRYERRQIDKMVS